MSIQSTGKWGFNYNRAFADLEKGETNENNRTKKGFRIYDKQELQSEKGFTWKAFKAAVLMMIGTTIKIDDKECIIGRRSFKEFVARVNSGNKLELKGLNMQDCINKLSDIIKKKQNIQLTENKSDKQVKAQAQQLADTIGKTPDPVVRRSPSMQNLQQALVEYGKHPDDMHAVQVEQAMEAVEARDPEAAEHLAIMPGSASPVRSEEAARPQKSLKQQAMERLTGWRGSEFQWMPKANLKRGLQDVWDRRANIEGFDENQFMEDIKHFKFTMSKGKIVSGGG